MATATPTLKITARQRRDGRRQTRRGLGGSRRLAAARCSTRGARRGGGVIFFGAVGAITGGSGAGSGGGPYPSPNCASLWDRITAGSRDGVASGSRGGL